MRKTGRTRNFNDTAVISKVTINETTATKLLDANDIRLSVTSSADNDIYPEQFQKIWIREKSASIDNTKEGDLIFPGGSMTMELNNIYTGEISAISEKGSIDLFITEK